MASGLSPIPRLRPYKPSSAFSGGWTNSFPKPKTYKTTSRRSGGMTLLTALKILHAKQKPHHSFLGGVIHKATHGLETALDYTARPSYAYMEGLREGATHGHLDLGKFYHGLGQGIHAHKRTGFGDIIRQEHPSFASHHKILTALGGLGVDIASDPTNLLVVGSAEKAAQIPADILRASRALRHGELDAKGLKAAQETFTKAGDDWKYHRALAEQLQKGPKELRGQAERAAEVHQDVLAQAAQGEFDKQVARKLAVKVKVPFGPEKTIVPTPFVAPSLKRIAERQGIIGNLGRVIAAPQIAEHLGQALKPGWNDPEYHALSMIGKHASEQMARHYDEYMAKHLGRFVSKGNSQLSAEEMRRALDVGIKAEGLLKAGRVIDRKVLRKLVKAGYLTKKQAEFLREWHNVTEFLRAHDAAYAIKYQKELENKLYVPALRDRFGQPLAARSGALTKPGYTYERLHSGRNDIQLMEELAQKRAALGRPYKDIETDPIALLHFRARRAAMAHANNAVAHVIAHAEGVPVSVLNPERMASLQKKIAYAEAQKEKHGAILRNFAEKLDASHDERRLRSLAKAEARHNDRTAALQRNLNRTRGKMGARTKRLKAAPKRGVPTVTRLLAMKEEDFRTVSRSLAAKKILTREVRTAKSLRLEKRWIDGIERKAKSIAPVTGAKAHGRHWKALVEELTRAPNNLLGETKGLLDPLKKGESWQTVYEGAIENIKHEHGKRTNEFKKQWDKFRPKAEAPLHAIRGKQVAAIARQRQQYEAKIARIEADFERRRSTVSDALEERMVRTSQRLDNLDAKLEKLRAQAENPHAFPHLKMKNPEVEAKNLQPLEALKDEHGNTLAVSQEMASGLSRLERAITDDNFVQEFGKVYRRLVARWKVGVTVVNPGYRARNTMSDLWNMYISGVPMWAIGRYGERAYRLMYAAAKPGREGHEQAVQTIEQAYRHGVLSGLFEGDVQKVLKTMKGEHTAKALAKQGHVISAFATAMTTGNRHAENWGRLTHYLYRTESQHMSAVEAAAKVRAAHFDYEDLTPAERKLKGSLIPFYTWTRKNIPYQLTQLASRPGRYSAFQKMINESEGASGDNKGQLVPDWMKQQLAFHVPFGGKGALMVPQFGPTDIEKLQHPSQLLSMISPMVKTPAELALNRSMLTGGPIYGNELKHPRNPIASWAGGPLSLIPGSNVGPTERPVHGKMTGGTGANPLLTYFLGQIPWTNLAISQSSLKRKQRGGNGALMSWLTGASTYTPDQESQLAQLNAQEQLSEQQWIRGLRDMGIIPEPKRKKSHSQKRLDSILKKKHAR